MQRCRDHVDGRLRYFVEMRDERREESLIGFEGENPAFALAKVNRRHSCFSNGCGFRHYRPVLGVRHPHEFMRVVKVEVPTDKGKLSGGDG